MVKKGTRQQWDQLGFLFQQVRDNLVKAEVLASGILPKKRIGNLSRARKLIDSLRNEAENLMFSRDGIEDNTIFYRHMKKGPMTGG